MGWFDGFRDDGLNTYYGGKRNPVIFDLTLLLIVFFTIVLSTAIIILVIGSRGRERWTTLLRFVMSLHTGVIILVSIFGLGWQTAEVKSMCSYTATYQGEVRATVGVNIGLKYVNITLRGQVNVSNYAGTINYNERFTYDKVTDMHEEYKSALEKGMPWPILSVLEYVSIDSGELRWMRGLHESGHFAYILLWCALIMWAVSNILVGFVVPRGALLWATTGLVMVISHVVYHALQPIHPLKIQFKDEMMSFSYGWCFWLHLTSGMITMMTGITILVFYYMFPDQTSLTFLIDTTHLQQYTDIKYTGTLDIHTPMTQRRKSMIPSSYSNPAFAQLETSSASPGAEAFCRQKRSHSFDFGHLTSGSGSLLARKDSNNDSKDKKPTPMTSITEHCEKEENCEILSLNLQDGKSTKMHKDIDKVNEVSNFCIKKKFIIGDNDMEDEEDEITYLGSYDIQKQSNDTQTHSGPNNFASNSFNELQSQSAEEVPMKTISSTVINID